MNIIPSALLFLLTSPLTCDYCTLQECQSGDRRGQEISSIPGLELMVIFQPGPPWESSWCSLLLLSPEEDDTNPGGTGQGTRNYVTFERKVNCSLYETLEAKYVLEFRILPYFRKVNQCIYCMLCNIPRRIWGNTL